MHSVVPVQVTQAEADVVPVLRDVQRRVAHVPVHADVVQRIRSPQPALKTKRFSGKSGYSRQVGCLHGFYKGRWTCPKSQLEISLARSSYLEKNEEEGWVKSRKHRAQEGKVHVCKNTTVFLPLKHEAFWKIVLKLPQSKEHQKALRVKEQELYLCCKLLTRARGTYPTEKSITVLF